MWTAVQMATETRSICPTPHAIAIASARSHSTEVGQSDWHGRPWQAGLDTTAGHGFPPPPEKGKRIERRRRGTEWDVGNPLLVHF